MSVPIPRVLLSVCAALLLITPAAADAGQYPVHQPVPGGIVRMELGRGADAVVDAKFGRRQILRFEENQIWIGIVGIDFDAPLGNYVVTVKTDAEDAITKGFTVIPHSYPFKAGREMRLYEPDQLPATWRPTLDAVFPLVSPVEYTSLERYGTGFAEGEGIAPVRCVLMRVPGSAEIKAPGKGIVYEIKEDAGIFYVTIDHGMSLYSMLGPLKRVTKKIGQSVESGERVGEYDSERSEHDGLNWKTILNGVDVNPLLFTEDAETSSE